MKSVIMPIAFIAIAAFGVWKIDPTPPYTSTEDLLTRLVGSIVWVIIFLAAAFASAIKSDSS